MEQMEIRRAEAKTVVTGEIVRVKSKDGPGLFESRRKGWTNEVVLKLMVQEVQRADPPIEEGETITIRYNIHHPPYGEVGAKRYDPPIPWEGVERRVYLRHEKNDAYRLAAGDRSFELKRPMKPLPLAIANQPTTRSKRLQATSETSLDTPISVNYKEADRFQILREVASIAGLNLIVPNELKDECPPVSLQINNVRWEQIYDHLLDPAGHSWYQDGSLVHIVPAGQVASTYTDVQLKLKNTDYAAIRPLLDALNEDRIVRYIIFNDETGLLSFRALKNFASPLQNILWILDEKEIRMKPALST